MGYGNASKNYTYDSYRWLTGRDVKYNSNVVIEENYTYKTYSDSSTNQLTTSQNKNTKYNVTYSYTYDDSGNITAITDGTNTTSYVYDSANQLIRENNQACGFTKTWTYDDAGNILSRKLYPYTSRMTAVSGDPLQTYTYTYGDSAWGDLLTAYNGVQWSYDQIGNLTNDGTWTYTWRNGRELASMSSGSTTWTYTYDANGMRTSRSNGSTTYTYVYNGSQLTQMTRGTDTLYFTYGAVGPTTVTWNGVTYYYAVNAQGDVMGIFDGSGNCVVTYNWDNAWGCNPAPEGTLAATLGTLNPLRYRSYVYDTETGLYYLQNRYYNPEICRFINADNQLSTGDLTGANLFAYCGNNPVNRIDPTGEAWWHWALGAAVVAVAAVATVVTCGGFAAAATAVCMVGSGVAAATTASTVAAAAFIGSATVYGAAVLSAVSSSNSVQEFNAQGNWGTVAATAGGAMFNGVSAYAATRTPTTTVYRSVSNAEAQDIKNTGRFNLASGGMESKQFGFNLSETRQFGNMMGQNTIVSAKVPNSMLNQLYTGGVDTSIFRAGTLTVYGDQLGAFNQAVSGTIKFMP